MVEKMLVPKPAKSSSEESKSTQGVKWSFAPGTNLLSAFGAKVERESRQKLNDFARELRSFRSVDMSGNAEASWNIGCVTAVYGTAGTILSNSVLNL